MIKAFSKPKLWITAVSAIACVAIAAAFLTLPPVAEAAPAVIIPEAVVIIPANTPSPTPTVAPTVLPTVAPENTPESTPSPTPMPTPQGAPPKHGKIFEWSEINGLWAQGEIVTVVDYSTRKTYKVMRVNGREEGRVTLDSNYHADFEPVIDDDTKEFKRTYGGKWSWDRRPVLVFINGEWVAASVNGMPHGEETIDDNGVSGFFCMHFYGSFSHNTGAADSEHQRAVLRAAGK